MSDIVATLQRYLTLTTPRYLTLTTPPAAFIGPLPRRTVEAAVAELERLREQLAAVDDPLDYAALCAELAVENAALRRQLAAVRAELAALAAEEPDRTL